MKKWKLYILVLIAVGCNRGELLDLKKQMDEVAETVKRIEAMRIQLVTNFNNIQALYEVLEQKLYVTAIDKLTDGTYILTYSDGSVIKLQNGVTPLITFGTDGEVIINGIGTGLKPQDGTDGYLPQVTINKDGFYVVDGVATDVKGTEGEAGQPLTVSIDAENYYCINGVRIVPEINLKPTDGTDGSAPVPTIEWNATQQKYELKINDLPTLPPTYVSPTDGDKGEAGGEYPYIKQVTMSRDDELIFTFSDNSTQKSSPVMLSDLVFTLETDQLIDLPLDSSVILRYTLKTKHATNPVTVGIYYPLNNWKAKIGPVNTMTNTGEITLTAIAGGMTTAEVLFLSAVDAQGVSIVRRITLVPGSYAVTLPDFTDSKVYDIYTTKGLKIAEACEESGLKVVYTYNPFTNHYGAGFVTNNSGTVNYSGLYYKAGSTGPVTSMRLAEGEIDGQTGKRAITSAPYRMTDMDGNLYAIIKEMLEYKTSDFLQVTHYNDGTRILHRATPDALESDGLYDNDAGSTYNGYAIKSGRLAPSGWRIKESIGDLSLFYKVTCIRK